MPGEQEMSFALLSTLSISHLLTMEALMTTDLVCGKPVGG
jgi:hypothetical protein